MTKSELAAALGSFGKGKPKTMTPAAMRQRKHAAKRPRPNRAKIAKALPMPEAANGQE